MMSRIKSGLGCTRSMEETTSLPIETWTDIVIDYGLMILKDKCGGFCHTCAKSPGFLHSAFLLT